MTIPTLVRKESAEQPTDYQIKVLQANETGTGAITDLTFNNLEVGKTYRLFVKMEAAFTTGGVGLFVLQATHDSANLLKVSHNDDNVSVDQTTKSNEIIFVATGTNITFALSATTSSHTLSGNGNANGSTYAMLEELPNHTETTKWN